MLIISKKLLGKSFADRNSKNIMKEVFKTKPEKQLDYLKARGKNLKTTVNWNDMDNKAHSQAFTVANIHSADILKIIYDKLEKAKSEGMTLKDFLKDTENIREITGLTENRLKVVYETNLNIAYAKGQFEHQQRLGASGIRPFIKYIGSTSEEKDPLHRKFYNMVFKYDDPFWNSFYPPSRFGCKCSTRALSQKEVESQNIKVQNGISLLKDLSKEDQKIRDLINNTIQNGLKINETFKPNLEKFLEKQRQFLLDQFSKKVFGNITYDEYKKENTSYIDSLDRETKILINTYVGNGYKKYNGVLRGTIKDDEIISQYSEYTKDLLEKDINYEIKNSLVLHRGEKFSYNDSQEIEFFKNQFAKLKTGSYSDRAFFSASAETHTAEGFGALKQPNFHTIMYKVYAPKGSRVGLGEVAETEFMFKPDSNFIVKSLDIQDKPNNKEAKVIFVELYYVP